MIESKQLVFDCACYLKEITSKYPLFFIFKASFDKANRTRLDSFRGPGLEKGIKILEEVKKQLKIPVLSDVHCCSQIDYVEKVLDVIQIPAFLVRQTDLVVKAAQTHKIINIKKAQFMSPYDIKYVLEKITSTGNKNIFITERGTCFGYNNLVVDFRSFIIMKKFGYPVIFDSTHSLQKPSLSDGISAGDRECVFPLSLAASACGVDGIFLETHPRPSEALSDQATIFPLQKVEDLIRKVLKVKGAISE